MGQDDTLKHKLMQSTNADQSLLNLQHVSSPYLACQVFLQMCTLPHSQNNRWFQCHYNINFNTLILPSPNEDETFVLTLRTITPSMDSSPCLKDILFHHQFSTSLLHMLLQWDQSCVHSDGVQILPVLPFREYYIT